MAKKMTDLEILNKDLPFKSEPRCKICQSVHRATVDRLLAAQFSNKSVAEELMLLDEDFKDKDPDTVRRNVERHSKTHLDIRNKAIRAQVERRAKEQGILIDHVDGKITSGRALLDTLVMQAQQQLADPNARVRYADAIEAVKLLEDVQKAEFQSQLEVLQKQVWAISQAVKNTVPETLWQPIVDEAMKLFDGETLEIEKITK